MLTKDIVGNIATVVTVGSFFAGVPVCLKVWRKGSTGDLSPTPFIIGNLCNALWLRYGLYVGDSTLVRVNMVGFCLQLMYIICFYLYTSNKASFYKQILLSGITLCILTIYLLYVADDIIYATRSCGMMAAAGSILFSASPLSVLAKVIQTKSTESMPFPVIFSSFLVTLLWFYYGLLALDPFVQVPNALGAAISGLQLCLFFIYPSKQLHAEVS